MSVATRSPPANTPQRSLAVVPEFPHGIVSGDPLFVSNGIF